MSAPAQFTNADALYATAIGAVHADQSIAANLSTVGKMALDAAWGAFKGPIVQVAEEAGLTLLSEGLSLLPPDVLVQVAGIAGDVAGAVGAIGELVPVLGAIISLVNVGISLSEAQDAQVRAVTTGLVQQLLTRPVIPSGPDVGAGPVVVPADIIPTDPAFVADPFPGTNTWLGADPIAPMPYTSIGLALAGITEGSWDGTMHLPEGGSADSSLRHTDAVWHNARTFYHLQNAGNLSADELRLPLGVPKAYRHLFQALRLAIGSRNVDQGRILWPIYMDLLLLAWDSGWISGSYTTWLLSHVFKQDPDGWPMNPGDDNTYSMVDAFEHNAGAPASAWVPYIDQIAAMSNAWRGFRNNPPPAQAVPKFVLNLGTMPKKLPPIISPLLRAGLIPPKMSTGKKVAIGAAVVTWGAVAAGTAYYFLGPKRRRNPAKRRRPHAF